MYRIGTSIDIHRLVEKRKLVLGGVLIPYEKGLLGHSDGDVLLHAITEAIIGALGLGDLGTLFPDDDMQYKDIDSKILLNRVYRLMDEQGYIVNNLDATMILETPKMKPHIYAIRQSVASLLHTALENINIKAATNEKLGEIGRGEAIQALATILLRKKDKYE